MQKANKLVYCFGLFCILAVHASSELNNNITNNKTIPTYPSVGGSATTSSTRPGPRGYNSPDDIEAFAAFLNITPEEVLLHLENANKTDRPVKTKEKIKENESCYCPEQIRDLAIFYRHIHGYVSLVVCLFGCVANVINVIVLTRKDMSGASINRILTGLACADMLVMLEYVPFACYLYLVFPDQREFPFSWAVFLLFHMHFTTLLHTISICLTLALAMWRFIVIRFPEHSRQWCTQQRCGVAITVSYCLPFLLCSPSYLMFSVQSVTVVEHSKHVILYHVGISDIARNHAFLYYFNLWVYGVVVKLIPCFILTIISCWLVKALIRVHQRKQQIKGYAATPTVETTPDRRAITKSERRTYRTTRMLVAILILFLITEFPQGIMGLLSGVLGECFFKGCYQKFGEMMDILALLNGAINFILYCSMSRQFRTSFGQLFKPANVLAKWTPSQVSVQSTYV